MSTFLRHRYGLSRYIWEHCFQIVRRTDIIVRVGVYLVQFALLVHRIREHHIPISVKVSWIVPPSSISSCVKRREGDACGRVRCAVRNWVYRSTFEFCKDTESEEGVCVSEVFTNARISAPKIRCGLYGTRWRT